jgi:type I restriction enzyme S subunit
MKTKQLPEGWKEVELPEILFFQEGPGVRNYQFTKKGIKLLNGRNIVDNTLILENTETYISEEEATTKYKHFLIDDGDLIIASSGIKVEYFHKKVAFAKKKHLPLCMNTSTIRFKSLDKKVLDINYFKYFLMTPYFSKQVKFHITGSAQLNFGPSHLKKMKIILPSLQTQKEIVSILEKAEKAKEWRKEADELTKDYLKSVFLDMFGDPFTNKKNFEVKKVREIVDLVNGKAFKSSDWSKEGLKIIRIQNLNNPKAKFNYYNGDIKSQYIVEKGDLLLSWSGTPGTSFGVFIWAGDKSVLNQHIFNVKIKEKTLNKLYFQFFINAKLMELISKAHGGVGLQHITKKELDNVDFYLPPIELQNKFSEIVKQVEAMKEQQKQSKEQTDNLFNALMQKAFKGELIK